METEERSAVARAWGKEVTGSDHLTGSRLPFGVIKKMSGNRGDGCTTL